MPPPDSRTTRTTNRGGGVETNETVLSVARGGSRDRRGGTLGPVAAPRRPPRAQRAAPRRRGGGGSPAFPWDGRRAGRGHRVFGLRVSILRVVCDGADAGDPRAADRHGKAAVALSRLSVAFAPILPLCGDGRPVRRRAEQVLADARPAVQQPPVGPDGEEPTLAVP